MNARPFGGVSHPDTLQLPCSTCSVTVAVSACRYTLPGVSDQYGSEAHIKPDRSTGDTMDSHTMREPARNPEDLARFFVVRANAGDVEGLVALYEPDAVLAAPDGQLLI